MPRSKMRGAVVTFAVAAMLGGVAAAAEADTSGPTSLGTPGMYGYEASALQYSSVQFSTKVTQDPGPTANVFWSNQFDTSNDEGYIGMQTERNAAGGRQILFSVWSAIGCRKGDPNYSPTCVSGSEGTPFQSARIWYPWVQGVKYRITVKKAPAQGPDWWVAYFHDPTKNLNVRIGYLEFGGPDGGKISPLDVMGGVWVHTSATCR